MTPSRQGSAGAECFAEESQRTETLRKAPKIAPKLGSWKPLTFAACTITSVLNRLRVQTDQSGPRLPDFHKQAVAQQTPPGRAIQREIVQSKWVRPDLFDRALNSKSFHPTSARLAMFTLSQFCQDLTAFLLCTLQSKTFMAVIYSQNENKLHFNERQWKFKNKVFQGRKNY